MSSSASSSPQSLIWISTSKSWQRKLQDVCDAKGITRPSYQLESDMRGGRTGWRAVVTVAGVRIQGRYLFEGEFNAKDDAAEVAYKNWSLSQEAQQVSPGLGVSPPMQFGTPQAQQVLPYPMQFGTPQAQQVQPCQFGTAQAQQVLPCPMQFGTPQAQQYPMQFGTPQAQQYPMQFGTPQAQQVLPYVPPSHR